MVVVVGFTFGFFVFAYAFVDFVPPRVWSGSDRLYIYFHFLPHTSPAASGFQGVMFLLWRRALSCGLFNLSLTLCTSSSSMNKSRLRFLPCDDGGRRHQLDQSGTRKVRNKGRLVVFNQKNMTE